MTLELSYITATSRLDRLGALERMALELVALGQSDDVVAARLGITPEAATALCAAAFDALGLRPTAYLGRRALARLVLRPAGRRSTREQKFSEVRVSAARPGSSSFRATER